MQIQWEGTVRRAKVMWHREAQKVHGKPSAWRSVVEKMLVHQRHGDACPESMYNIVRIIDNGKYSNDDIEFAERAWHGTKRAQQPSTTSVVLPKAGFIPNPDKKARREKHSKRMTKEQRLDRWRAERAEREKEGDVDG